MATKEELQAKSDATRLKNLLTKKAEGPLSKWDATMLKNLQAKLAASKTQKPDWSQTALSVVHKATGTNTFETNPKVLTLASERKKAKPAKQK